MNKPMNKIEAIKAIRSLPFKIETRKSEYQTDVQAITVDLGLKEAKDLVEAIMSLEPSSYSLENLKAEIDKANQRMRLWREAYYNLKQTVYNSLDTLKNPDENPDYPSF